MNKQLFLMAGIALMPVCAIAQQSRQLVVSEGANHLTEGAVIERTVALAAAPGADVTVRVMSSDDERLDVKSGAVMTFTAENWDVPQTAVFEAVNDYTCNGDVELDITYFSISKDKAFSECKRVEKVTVEDNDKAALSITPNPVEINKMTKQGTLFVRLKAQPMSEVTVQLRSTSAAISIPTPIVTFSPVNWNVVQKVTVLLTGDMSALEGLEIEATSSSESAAYSSLSQTLTAILTGTEATKERLKAEEAARARQKAEAEAMKDGSKQKKEKELTPEQKKKAAAKAKAAKKKEAEKAKKEAKKAKDKAKAEAKKAAAKKAADKKKAAAKKKKK